MCTRTPIIRISRLLPSVVRHDKAGVQFLDSPRRREAALVFGQVRLGCVFEGRIVQKRAGSRMDVLLLGLIDYPCLVEAVGLYGH